MWSLFRSRPPLDLARRTMIELLSRRAYEMFGEDRLNRISFVTIDDPMLSLPLGELRERIADYFEGLFGVSVGLSARKIELTATDPLRRSIQIATECVRQFLKESVALPSCRFIQDDCFLELLLIGAGWAPVLSHATLYSTSWNTGDMEGWEFSRSGHLSAEDIGYSTSVLSKLSTRDFGVGLSLDSQGAFRQAEKFNASRQQKNECLLFRLEELPDECASSTLMKTCLQSEYQEVVLVALWYLEYRAKIDEELAEGLLESSKSLDESVRWYTATLLGRAAPTISLVDCITRLVGDSALEVAIAAANSAYVLGFDFEKFGRRIDELLHLTRGCPSGSLMNLLARLGPASMSLQLDVCKQLRHALHRSGPVREIAECLLAISDNPHPIVQRVFRGDHMQELALGCLEGNFPTDDDLFRAGV